MNDSTGLEYDVGVDQTIKLLKNSNCTPVPSVNKGVFHDVKTKNFSAHFNVSISVFQVFSVLVLALDFIHIS